VEEGAAELAELRAARDAQAAELAEMRELSRTLANLEDTAAQLAAANARMFSLQAEKEELEEQVCGRRRLPRALVHFADGQENHNIYNHVNSPTITYETLFLGTLYPFS
jgi:hypothetical protein